MSTGELAVAARAEQRALPALQRAYFYVVALVAIHMIVLGAANLLRVGAEIALDAPSGGFTGLPFIFAEFNRPHDLYREQASLALALLLVAVPVWWLHFRSADAAAQRSPSERGSALRSAYLHIVIFVTALLVFGYGQRVIRLVLMALLVGPNTGTYLPIDPSGKPEPPGRSRWSSPPLERSRSTCAPPRPTGWPACSASVRPSSVTSSATHSRPWA